MEKMAVWAAVLIVYGVFPRIATQPPGAVANTVLPLDLAENSVDDWYSTCKDQMFNVVNQYLMNEKNTNSNFKDAWNQGEEYYNNRWKDSKVLEKEQIVAIYAYTSASGNIHEDFNAAVRSQRSQYKTTFGYHAFHFYLTVALQALKAKERDLGEKCFTVYRRDAHYFSQNVLNREIRFGSFTSTSKGRYVNAETFGNKSCFEINTCSGADVSFFSKFADAEGEVLIPPYEVFKVTAIQKRSANKNLPCDVVYTLKSTRFFSNLDCALFKK